MEHSSRKIWEQPWGYAEGFLFAIGICLAGIILQLSIGKIEPALFAFPVNSIIGALFLTGLLAVHLLAGKKSIVRWLSGVYATIPALVLLLTLSVILGAIQQQPQGTAKELLPPNLFGRLGWYRMTTSWPFVLLCFYTLVILGLTTLRRTAQKQRWRDIGFYLNHLGLFIALLGGLLGSADMVRVTMSVQEGAVEWRSNNSSGETMELSLAIQLDSFLIEEYPPKLVIIEHETGRMLPEARPVSYQFEGVGKTVQLAGYSVEIIDYLAHAALFKDSVFTNVVPMMMEGATTAIKVKVNQSGHTAS